MLPQRGDCPRQKEGEILVEEESTDDEVVATMHIERRAESKDDTLQAQATVGNGALTTLG